MAVLEIEIGDEGEGRTGLVSREKGKVNLKS